MFKKNHSLSLWRRGHNARRLLPRRRRVRVVVDVHRWLGERRDVGRSQSKAEGQPVPPYPIFSTKFHRNKKKVRCRIILQYKKRFDEIKSQDRFGRCIILEKAKAIRISCKAIQFSKCLFFSASHPINIFKRTEFSKRLFLNWPITKSDLILIWRGEKKSVNRWW